MDTIILVGAGRMGGAMLRGWMAVFGPVPISSYSTRMLDRILKISLGTRTMRHRFCTYLMRWIYLKT